MAEDELAWWHATRRPAGWSVPDAAIAALFLALLATEILGNDEMTPRLPLLGGALVIAVPLAWRRVRPVAVALVVCVANLVASGIATGPFPPQLAIVPVLVAIYTAASLTRGWWAVLTAVATGVVTAAAWVVTPEGHPDDFWPWMLWAGAWAGGTFVRRRTDVAAHHAARAALLEVEARTTAEESAHAERDRIAREMHDVVAHSVSVMVVQAGAERLRLGPAAGRTGQALAAIEESGRAALAELRGMLGMLRDGSDERLAPLQGTAALPNLVARVREAGLTVELACRPEDALEDDRLGASSAGLAAYRIVQEALTNVMRHEGLVTACVEVEVSGDGLRLSVRNPSSSHGRPSGSSGRGLLGMRERAAALGGSLDTFERDGEYVVSARLPLRAEATP